MGAVMVVGYMALVALMIVLGLLIGAQLQMLLDSTVVGWAAGLVLVVAIVGLATVADLVRRFST